MEIDYQKLESKIALAKKIIAGTRFKSVEQIDFVLIRRVNTEVCLVVADFRCQKCKRNNNLTLHHLIMRKAIDYMDFNRYVSQRYYWANQIILCKKCHAEYHNMFGKDLEEMGTISQHKIDKIKTKYLRQSSSMVEQSLLMGVKRD
jgi:5-methylcytosine-specific restriction endonuclease McrA